MVKLFLKRDRPFVVYSLLLVVLVPYFLFQTNFVYEVVGSQSWSLPLSGYRMNGFELYSRNGFVNMRSAYGAQWLGRNFAIQNSTVYADQYTAGSVLLLSGISYTSPLYNTTIVANYSAVYLGSVNVVTGVIPYFYEYTRFWYSRNFSNVYDTSNLVYANGGSLVYRHSP